MQIQLTEAQEALDGAITPVAEESVETTKAEGRWLAAPALAAWDLPRESVSAMDGWAVDAEDLATASPNAPVTLPQGEATHAGQPRGGLPEGGCAWVATGAAVPRGATAVVPCELAEEEEVGVRFSNPVRRGLSIRVAGEDLAAGDKLAAAGERLTPWGLQALLTAGVEQVQAVRAPRVALVASGDELYLPGSAPKGGGGLPASNLFAVAGLAAREGAQVVSKVLVGDDQTALAKALAKARDAADLVVAIGGASKGRRDHAPEAYLEAGAKMLFKGVRIKPGKPVFAVRWAEGTVGLGLPGNAVSSLVTFELLGVQAIRRLVGAHWYRPAPQRFQMEGPLSWRGGNEGFLPARVASLSPPRVALAQQQGSHRVAGLAGADCLLRLPNEPREFGEGDEVEVLRWI